MPVTPYMVMNALRVFGREPKRRFIYQSLMNVQPVILAFYNNDCQDSKNEAKSFDLNIIM